MASALDKIKQLSNKAISFGNKSKAKTLGGVDLGTTETIPGFTETEETKKARMVQGFKEQQGKSFGKTITGLAKAVVQGGAQSGGAIGLTLATPFVGTQEIRSEDLSPFQRKIKEIIFGETPVKSIQTRIAEGEVKTAKFGRETGIGFIEKGALPLSIIGVGAIIGLDFTTGGGKDDVIKLLVKTDKVGDVANILRKIGVADDLIPAYSKTISKLNKVDDVAKALDKIQDIQKTTKSVSMLKPTKFAQRVKELPTTAPEVKKGIVSYYTPQTNKVLVEEANKAIKTNFDEAVKIAKSPFENPSKANVYAQQLIVDYQKAGRYEEAIDLVEDVSRRATEQGRAIQTLSLYERLEPEGILRATQRMLDQANVGLKPNKMKKLSEEASKSLVASAKALKSMKPGRAKTVATAELLGEMMDVVPVSVWKKVGSIQTMAQLLNPKTAIRNLGGNFGFAVVENINQVPASMFDSALSLFTKKRTVGMPQLLAQGKGFKQGLKEGVEDALKRIDTATIATRYDLPKGKVFKGKVGGFLEKLLNLELKATDRAFYKSAFDGSLAEQMLLKKTSVATDEMLEIAHYDGLYKTFQDDNVISGIFTKIKSALNTTIKNGKITTGDFGLGDFVLKYPKTPGNLLARGIDYSPAGFVNAVFEMAHPLVGKPFNQRAFVQAFSRATTGSAGLVGTGALLHKLGIITGRYEKDKDVRGIQKITGLGQYKINVSALKRFIFSGFNPETTGIQEDDTLITYDWFQPMAIGLSIGANIDEGGGQKGQTGDIFASLLSGLDTLGEQPLISGLQRAMGQQTFSESAKEVLRGMPSSFVPTFLSQITQLIDNTQRNAYSPSEFQYAFNLAKAKIPGIANTLPASVDVFGDDLERYQGETNNVFNVLFNPAFQTQYKTTPEAELVLDLINTTGETTQTPRIVDKSVMVNGESVKLTPEQITALQRYVGTTTKQVFANIASVPSFQELSPEEKIKILSSSLTSIMSAGKIVILGDIPKNPSKETMMILLMNNGLEQ